MVETSQKRVLCRLQNYDSHPSRGESEVEDGHSGQKEEQQREQDGSEQELVQIVITGVDTISQYVVLLAPEQMEQGHYDAQLPAEDPSGGGIETVDVDSQE